MGQLEDWYFNRISRLGRLINRVNDEDYRPMPQPRRHYFTSLLYVCLGLAGIDYFFWAYVWWYPSWLGLWPMWSFFAYLCFSFSGYLILERWTDSAPKCRPGLLDLFTITDESRNLQPIKYDTEDGKPNKVVVYQMAQLGGLLGDWIQGSYILISPILEDEISETLSDAYRKSGRVPKLPEDKSMSFGRKWGDILEVPGDLDYYVLGNSADGLEPDIRGWIKDVYSTTWNERWVVMMARDVMTRRKKELLELQPVAHESNHRSALRDARHAEAFWKGKYEEMVRQGSRLGRIASRGGRSLPNAQEMYNR